MLPQEHSKNISNMKKNILYPLFLFFIILLPGCELIEGVFRAGIWFALVAVLIIAALIYLLFSTALKPKKVTVSSSDVKKKEP